MSTLRPVTLSEAKGLDLCLKEKGVDRKRFIGSLTIFDGVKFRERNNKPINF
jgi:hypothetical protein